MNRKTAARAFAKIGLYIVPGSGTMCGTVAAPRARRRSYGLKT